MKFLYLSFAFILAFLTATTALATTSPLPAGMTTVPLAAITNDRDTSVSQIELMVDQQATVRGIYLATRASKQANPDQASGQVYWLSSIESNDGVVLGQGQGVKAILLSGQIQSQAGHGSLVVKYLSNGIFRSYNECRLDLQRRGPNNWQLVNAYNGQTVKHIQVETWTLGISTLANVCPAEA